MNVHISYKVHKTPDIERELNHLLEKLKRRLRAFRPELVHLKGLIEQNSPREGAVVSLNLRLPSGQMAVHESATNALAALKTASDDLVFQVGKHKDLLRSSHKWRRGGADSVRADSAQRARSPVDRSGTALQPIPASPADTRSYVNAHLGRLERFVERELYFRETTGQVNSGSVTKDEVVDEVVVRALGEAGDGTEHLALEPWLYRLAIQSMNDLTSRASQGIADLRLNGSVREPDVSASGENELEFHQPDEFMSASDLIADRAASTPEDIAYSDELMSLVRFALGDGSRIDRESFVLNALEGFSVAEIAAITDRKPDEIQSSVDAARARLRRLAPFFEWIQRKAASADWD
jgi:DNA-directed RNA polymerase specialized sigma24 family protein/ribosome-associated translation inhibitor RaiA